LLHVFETHMKCGTGDIFFAQGMKVTSEGVRLSKIFAERDSNVTSAVHFLARLCLLVASTYF
jgi:hypothetical protein